MKDLVLKAVVRSFAGLLVALSGLILFADKITSFTLEENYGFSDTKTLIWVFSQSVSPLVLILGSVFKPYKIAYTIPIYIYFIQIYWIFQPRVLFDDIYLQVYALGFVILFILLVASINVFFHKADRERSRRISNLENALDLDLVKVIQRLIRYISKDIKNKYIPERERAQYVTDYLNELNQSIPQK